MPNHDTCCPPQAYPTLQPAQDNNHTNLRELKQGGQDVASWHGSIVLMDTLHVANRHRLQALNKGQVASIRGRCIPALEDAARHRVEDATCAAIRTRLQDGVGSLG